MLPLQRVVGAKWPILLEPGRNPDVTRLYKYKPTCLLDPLESMSCSLASALLVCEPTDGGMPSERGERMKSKLFRLLVVAIALIGVSVVGAPSTSQAVIITDVVVHVGPAGPAGNQWCGTAGCSGEVAAGTFVIWSFPVGGINLGTSST